MTVSEPTDEQRLEAAGIDVNQLAPGWDLVDVEINGTVQAEIVWDEGTIMASLAPAAYDDCIAGYVCYFENTNYGGRVLQFSAIGLVSSMATYSFNDQMSSWRSRRSLDARWYYDTGGSGTSRCVESISSNADVGAGVFNADNDEMSSARIYDNDNVC
ncbi:peptidase inhibitor family I36 protein [Spongisporangium articulatum]|uniref:Peptidase inhibitor family I36 protein n=1 Tax=Spongisporangium articulatum TaxID=3362603 RepID=A0ABW8ASG3_9ACTN